MELAKKHCVPCEGGMPPMPENEEKIYMKEVPGWELDTEGKHRLIREFRFKDFSESMKFVNRVAEIAERERHHPNIHIYWNRVRVVLSTHAIGGLSENDFIMAAKMDEIASNW
jgi:4a-hydroxytetrahydrobiopterin dehydratase